MLLHQTAKSQSLRARRFPDSELSLLQVRKTRLIGAVEGELVTVRGIISVDLWSRLKQRLTHEPVAVDPECGANRGANVQYVWRLRRSP